MSNTALNRTSVALLTNKSGAPVAQGDVVIVDSANAAAFTTTTTAAYSAGSIGVVIEPNGIASNAIGSVAFGGYVPIVNLSGSASLGDLFKTHTVAKQAARHAGPIAPGDFGQVLGTGTTPAAQLWGQPSASVVSTTLAADTDVSISSPADGQTLIYDGSHWVNKKSWVVQLDYAAATDLANSTAYSAATWTDIIANQTFTVDDANSLVEIWVGGNVLVQPSSGGAGSRIVIDSAGTPINKQVGGNYVATGDFANVFAGASPITVPGLSAGSHTVKVQFFASLSGNWWCLASTNPEFYGVHVRVIERK